MQMRTRGGGRGEGRLGVEVVGAGPTSDGEDAGDGAAAKGGGFEGGERKWG